MTNSFNFLNNFNSIVPNDINNTNHKSTSIEQFRTDKRKSFDHSMQLSNMTINDIFEDKPNLVNLNSIDKSKRIINENINNIIIEEDSNLNTLTYNYNKNAFQQLRSELDYNFNEENNSTKYLDINHNAIQKDIEE